MSIVNFFILILIVTGTVFVFFPSGNTEKITLKTKVSEVRYEKEKFINDYFSEIKERPIEESWGLLSINFKRDKIYIDYIDWWERKVESIVVKDVYTSKDNKVHTVIHYKLKNGNEYCSHDYFDVALYNDILNIESQEYSICD